MSDTLLKVVDLASDVKKYIGVGDLINPTIDIDRQKRNLIESANDDDFIMLIKKIGSAIKIIDVKIISDDILNNYLSD